MSGRKATETNASTISKALLGAWATLGFLPIVVLVALHGWLLCVARRASEASGLCAFEVFDTCQWGVCGLLIVVGAIAPRAVTRRGRDRLGDAALVREFDPEAVRSHREAPLVRSVFANPKFVIKRLRYLAARRVAVAQAAGYAMLLALYGSGSVSVPACCVCGPTIFLWSRVALGVPMCATVVLFLHVPRWPRALLERLPR